jgi:WD40 repeat protein
MPLKTLSGHRGDVHAVVITPDNRRIASAGDDKQIIMWDIERAKPARQWPAHEKAIPTLALSPDGKVLASGSRDNTIRLWNPATGKLRDTLIGHTEDVMSVRFSPDGKWLASASYDQTVRLWDVASGKALRIFHGHTNRVFNAAFSPDGKRLASAGDSTARIWNTQDGTPLKVISLGGAIATTNGVVAENISSVEFNPNGQMLAMSSTIGITFLVAAETGDVVRKFSGPGMEH